MTALIITVSLVFLGLIVFQIARVRELSAAIRGEAEAERKAADRNGYGLMAFVVVFLVGTIASAWYYRNYILGYGPWVAASEHGGAIDTMINTTLIITGIAFVLTNVALFYFAYKYRSTVRRRADFISHDNKLEVVWTLIPAVVMTLLVVGGLDAWNEVMADVPDSYVPGEDYLEIEATGYQFAWDIRYPGADNLIGTKNYKLISGTNPVGQDWTDLKNHDDFIPNEIVLPVGKRVRVRITSKDVLHNFYLPHFTVKMDAVPGMPTYFVFTPTITTDSMRRRLADYPEFAGPYDPDDPEGPTKAEAFNYELACAELCGTGHWSMKKPMRVVSEAEYNEWAAGQQSWYLSTIRGTDDDPFKGQPVPVELAAQRATLIRDVETAMVGRDEVERTVRLENVSYETGSAALTSVSGYELDNVVELLGRYPEVRFEIAGHTDDTGDAAANQLLSQARAQSVADYLTANGISPTRFTGVNGYGSARPVDEADTDEARALNRRTEFVIAPFGEPAPASEEAPAPDEEPAPAPEPEDQVES